MAGINGYKGVLQDFVRGTTVITGIKVQDENQNAIDITGSKFYLTFSTVNNSSIPPLFEIAVDPPTSPINGKTDIKITDTQTLELTPGNYFYSIRYVNSIGEPSVFDMGRVKVYDCISQRIA
jgi:hypothetical protein